MHTRNRFSATAVSLAVAVLMSACASIAPMEYEKKAVVSSDAAKNMAEGLKGWDETAVVSEGTASAVLMTPSAPPPSVRNRKVDIELEPGATVADLVAILSRLGVPAIISDAEVSARTFYLPKYSGSLGGLLSAVTRATDTWFTWHDGTMVVSATEKIGVAIPQEADFAEELTKGISSLGLKGTNAVSYQAGMASLEVTPKEFSRVRTYLERMTSNAAMVTMQMVIIDVGMDQAAKKGIDWDKLNVAMQPLGKSADLKQWQTLRSTSTGTGATTTKPGTGTTTGGTTTGGTTTGGTTTGGTTGGTTAGGTTSGAAANGSTVTGYSTATNVLNTTSTSTSASGSTTTTSGTTGGATTGTGTTTTDTVTEVATNVIGSVLKSAKDSTSSLPAAVAALQLASGNVGAAIIMDKFSFEGMFGFLQTYGKVETRQNVVLKTVTGNKVTLQSVTKVPYVSSVSATTTGTAASNVTGSSSTSQAEDGIKVELLPTYDAAGNSVTVAVDLSLKAVLQFNELSAGNQLGTLTQPTTADRSFNDKVRLRPGQTAVIGGLTYDTVSDARGAPLYMQRTPLESQNLQVKRTSTFIVLRPTITRLGRIQEQDAAQGLDLLPSAEDPVKSAPAARKTKGVQK